MVISNAIQLLDHQQIQLQQKLSIDLNNQNLKDPFKQSRFVFRIMYGLGQINLRYFPTQSIVGLKINPT